MRRITSLLAASLTVALIAGCHSSQKQQPPAAATIAFDGRMHDHGSVTFRSWNGEAHRMDSDTELAFFPNGAVQMLEWGFALVHYNGHYHVDRDGRITASFDDYQPKWPQTLLELEADTLLLRPIDPDAGYLVGQRGAVFIPGRESGFWPFRMLDGEEEQKVLEMMKQRSNTSRR